MSTPAIPVTIKPVRNIIGLNTAGSGGSGQVNPTTGTIQVTSALQVTTITADAVVEEESDDESVVTEHPVEVGSVISDHMFDLPSRLGLIYAWSIGSPQNAQQDQDFLKNLYQKLLSLKSGKVLCTVNTGKRQYQNMVLQRVSLRTDKENENSMTVHVDLKQIIQATTQLVPLSSAAVQAQPQNTAPTVNQGNVNLQPAPNFNASRLP
jgi:hypothetical protein